MSELNLYQRMLKASGQAIKKDCWIEINKKGDGYKALSHDKVTSVVNPLLNEVGVLFIASEESSETKTVMTKDYNGNDKVNYFVNMKIKGEFINVDNPDEKHVVFASGHGIDTLDKAPGKAMSYAVKYAMLKALNLFTGDNDEDRAAKEISPTEKTKKMQTRSGDYICSFGKFKDVCLVKAIKDKQVLKSGEIVTVDLLQSYVEYLENKAKKENKEVPGFVKEFINEVERISGV